jgi:TPR repeat protein
MKNHTTLAVTLIALALPVHAGDAEKAQPANGKKAALKASPQEAKALFDQAEKLDRAGQVVQAIPLYKRAAALGSGPAARRLGDIYDRGAVGVGRDYGKSLKWYEEARRLGEQIRILPADGGPR